MQEGCTSHCALDSRESAGYAMKTAMASGPKVAKRDGGKPVGTNVLQFGQVAGGFERVAARKLQHR